MYGMLYETAERALGYEVVCDQLLSIAVIQLLRFTRCSLAILGSGGLPAQCSMVQQYISNHFKEDLNLDQLANQCGLNKFYLVHSFKKATGTTPINYLNQVRLQEAEKLLRTTDLPVSKIAQDVGFSSQNGFSQSFCRFKGVSPIHYRQAQRVAKTTT
ncbi:HTH-type transcriptional activator RhaS [bioreactor metagenome]|uniref:HTH-type transcriptional activator RhaS n=1 Tax=bioreactor metagenome TaxID=1076179 RepID=A0A645J3Y1_9ZZZZ